MKDFLCIKRNTIYIISLYSAYVYQVKSKSGQKVLLQQNHKHTWNNTETETHWVYLPHTILASVTLQ